MERIDERPGAGNEEDCKMKKKSTGLVVSLLTLFMPTSGQAEAPDGGSAPAPSELSAQERCYVQVAQRKSNADMAYIAREICDAVYGTKRRSLFVLDPKARVCTEWWFDTRGRFEDSRRSCALEATGARQWDLACQLKDRAAGYTVLRLVLVDGQWQRQGKLLGVDPGVISSSMAGCIRQRAGGGAI